MEPDRSHHRAERLDRAAVRAPGRRLTADEIRSRVEPRLGAARRAHVEAVAETIGRLTREWGADSCAAALRAAWFHDAWRSDGVKETAAAIRAAGEEPDAWASLHAPVLLHAQAAAAWARSEMAETDSQVLLAVRHHSTGHPAWEDVGRALYVADFCEPTRPFAASLQTDGLVVRAAADPASLAAVALEILMLRLAGALRQKRPIHPDSWCTWNAWVGGATDA